MKGAIVLTTAAAAALTLLATPVSATPIRATQVQPCPETLNAPCERPLPPPCTPLEQPCQH